MSSSFARFVVVLSLSVLSSCACNNAGATCVTEADCTDAAAKLCDPNSRICVACVTDEHCEEGFICANGACEAGCRTDTDRCAAVGFCKPGVGCVSCLQNSNCPAGQLCTNNVCVAGCSAQNPTCPSGQVCNPTRGVCVECVDNSQCPNTPLNACDPATGTCVQCVTGTDCRNPMLPVCDPASHTCVGCLTNTDCPNGVCQMNRCVQCLSDAQCSGATPRCDTATNTCVACIPGPTDNCPTGQYCRPDNRCEQGCKTGADCPSGVCLPNHSCQMCTSDMQCAAGNVCQNGTCVGACSATTPCGANETCCNGRCEALQTDVNNCGVCGRACGMNQACCAGSCRSTLATTDCGACGVSCTADQFCDGISCKDKTFPNFCANRNVVAIRDGIPLDNAATTVLASTITQNCSINTNLTYADDTDPMVVQQDGGALLLGGGYTVVTAGGPFPNLPVKWLERTRRVTKVYFSNNTPGTEFYFKQRLPPDAGMADPIIVTRLQSACLPGADGGGGGATNDVFLVELAIDPTSGTLALITYGLCSPGNGTQAAAWYWANVMLPNRNTYMDSWYLYEWTDTNGNGTPEITDTWARLASGN